jgi:hypothetical protein
MDNTQYSAYQLCSAWCKDDADCMARFGANTLCAPGSVCLKTCHTNNDCISGTICNSKGYCERGGPGSGVPLCTGTLGSCAEQVTSPPCRDLGCQWSGGCVGTADQCSANYTMAKCLALRGCSWNTNIPACIGASYLCGNLGSESDCQEQAGCSWTGTCSGTSQPKQCSDINQFYCPEYAGCSLSAPQ